MNFIKIVFTWLLLLICVSVISQENPWQGKSADFSHGKLKVSKNKRYIVYEDGTPFFYLGDTGWELFHRLNKMETEKYLENRREKGFTVIQAVALAELDGLNSPNAEGNKPLTDNNPLKPNEAYFAHVDWVIKKAAEKGIFIGLLPTWGDKIDKTWGIGPEIFNKYNAMVYGKWIANRYKSEPNIIWIMGGDRDWGGKNTAICDAMAEGIKSVDKNHLMTLHPGGERSSSDWFHDRSWLDFNMSQTGHVQRNYSIIKRIIVRDYNLKPVKPCFDGEPRYEDHPVSWNPNVFGWFDDADVRQALYWDLFSGAHGHTYGCHPVWQMLAPGRDPVGLARHNWYDVLDLPGALDLIHARRLMESRPFISRVPDQSMIVPSYIPETDYVVATRGKGYAFVYFPTGWEAKIILDKVGAKFIKAYWYNPRNGETKFIEEIPGTGTRKFVTPSAGRGNDWVLILDDASKNFTANETKKLSSFTPGEIWKDNNGIHINAHGGGMLYDKDIYYWFGEHKVQDSLGNKAEVGVHVYSSKDLYNWKDEGIALKVSDDPKSDIAKGCILERPKVIYNEKTKKFVMWFHLELLGHAYLEARSGVAIADAVTGPYTFIESFRPNAGVWPINIPAGWKASLTKEEKNIYTALKFPGGPEPGCPEGLVLRGNFTGGQMARDMTVFKDDDGKAYHIYASEDNGTLQISQLTDDYLKPAGKYARIFPLKENESPAMFKHNGKYYLITSKCNGWNPSDARMGVSESIWGPWTALGNPCVGPEELTKITFESQSTYVLPVAGKKDAFIFMADRWRPANAIDGRYIWLPMEFEKDKPIIKWHGKWDLAFFNQ